MASSPLLLVAGLLLTLPSPALAQSPPESRRLVPPRISTPITLDGRLDEPIWATAALAKGFLQNDPREGAPATFDTEVRVLYDADAIYLGVFAKDDAPQKLIVSELRKDFDTSRSSARSTARDTPPAIDICAPMRSIRQCSHLGRQNRKHCATTSSELAACALPARRALRPSLSLTPTL